MSLSETLMKISVGSGAGATVGAGLALAVGLPPAGAALVTGGITAMAIALSGSTGKADHRVGNFNARSIGAAAPTQRDPSPIEPMDEDEIPESAKIAKERWEGYGTEVDCPRFGKGWPFPHGCHQANGPHSRCEDFKQYKGSRKEPHCDHSDFGKARQAGQHEELTSSEKSDSNPPTNLGGRYGVSGYSSDSPSWSQATWEYEYGPRLAGFGESSNAGSSASSQASGKGASSGTPSADGSGSGGEGSGGGQGSGGEGSGSGSGNAGGGEGGGGGGG